MHKIKLLSISMILLTLTGCARQPTPTTSPPAPSTVLGGTSEPSLAKTLQAVAEATAAWVAEQTIIPPPTEQPPASPTIIVLVEGIPPDQRTGPCPVPEGYTLHDREGFCIAAPESWTALNVDGGLAAALLTTPGQSISLQPDWADSTAACHLMVYISTDSSAADYLDTHYQQFTARHDLQVLSLIQMQSLGGLALPGFTWLGRDGSLGGLYAAPLAPHRLAVISLGGSNCPVENLLPVIETLRFDTQ